MVLGVRDEEGRGGAEDRRRGRGGPPPLPDLEVILYLNEKL